MLQKIAEDLPRKRYITTIQTNGIRLSHAEDSIGRVIRPRSKHKKNKKVDETIVEKENKKEGPTDEKKSEESVKPKKGLWGKKTSFKRVAKMIKTNITWSHDIDPLSKEASSAYKVKGSDGKEMTLTFDVNNFKVSSYNGGLSAKAKSILRKSKFERSKQDMKILRDVIAGLKCFKKYSKQVKEELSRVISFEVYEDGRVLIKQGHMGMSFYFIVSGAVSVISTDIDKSTGKQHMQILGELQEGSSFGELAIVHNMKRTATIVCKGHSEFLRVDRPDFEEVLAASERKEWDRRLRVVKDLDIFKNWTPEEMQSCNHKSRIIEYPANKVILGNTKDKPENLHIIILGECRMVRDIDLIKKTFRSGRSYLRLPHSLDEVEQVNKDTHSGGDEEHHKRSNTEYRLTAERHLWSLYNLKKGQYFGIGEDLTDTYIVSRSKVECLLVPQLEFTKHGYGKFMDNLCKDLNATIPRNEELMGVLKDESQWITYKDSVINEIVSRKKIPKSTKYEDIPQSICVEQRPVHIDRISKSF